MATADVRVEAGRVTGPKGTGFFWREWSTPGARPKTVALFVHGMGEHSGRYEDLGRYFASRGMPVFAFDLRGFGQSGGTRGHVDRFQDYVDDVLFFREMVGTRHPGAKVVLIGHSLGGLIALATAARHGDRFAAVTVSGPPLRLALEVPGWKATLGKILSGIAPKFAMTNELDPGDLARNPEVGRKYVADPLVERKVTARFFISLTEGMAETAASAASVRIPACIMHGTADRLTHFEGSRLFYDGLGDIPKALKLWDGFYHELFQEDEKEDVFREVLSFLVDQGLVAAA